MRLENWFYSENDVHTVKSLDELMGLYYYSVGRGSNLLINIAPDRHGRLPAEDKKALLEMGNKIREIFSDYIDCKVTAESNKITLEAELQLVNHITLSEEITGNDEIESFEIKAYPYPYGAPITVYTGKTIGHKAICCFPAIKTDKIEIIFDKDKKVTANIKYIRQY